MWEKQNHLLNKIMAESKDTLQSLLGKMLNEHLTKEEFVTTLKGFGDLIKKIQDRNVTEFQTMHKNIALNHKNALSSIGSQVAGQLLNHKDDVRKYIDTKHQEISDKVSLISDGEDGEDGKNADEDAIFSRLLNKIPKNDLTPFLNALSDRLEEIEKRLTDEGGKGPVTVYGPGKTKLIVLDLSTQLNGSLKTFRLGTNFGIVSVSSSSAPFGAFRPIIDYNGVGPNIVFTSNVDAPSALPAGQSLIVTILK